MDQDLDQSKQASMSYRQTFRRHRKLLCMPIILGGLAAAFFVFGMGKTYTSTANLWVDTTATAPSSVGDSTTSPLAEPPAAAEQAVLSELLTTRAFAASVAQNSALGKSLGSADAIRENAAGLLGGGQVVAAATGGQILQISYSASSPAMAESVLGAVIAQLRNYTDRLRAQHNEASVAYAREQVSLAEGAVETARRNVTTYRERHPGVSQTDPKYVSVVAAEKNAVKQLAEANSALSQMTGTGNAGGWSVRVIDSPSQASTVPLRKSKIAEVILGGLLGGLLVSFLAVVALTPAKKEMWEDELPKKKMGEDELVIGDPLFPDVPPADPFRAGSSGTHATPERSTPAPAAVGHPGLPLGDRGWIRTPPAPTEEQ